MSTVTVGVKTPSRLGKAFWVVWAIELWERFGFYGVQAILALYFVQQLGYKEDESFYVFGSFNAFVYGFVWLGGWIGDRYLGAKRTLVLGAILLMVSYAAMAMATHDTIFYALSGIVVGNALFKANPSSLVSKMFNKGDGALDGAMTLYYMAVNLGSCFSMALTPIIAQRFGWHYAYALCSLGLLLGLLNYYVYRQALSHINTVAELQPLCLKRLSLVLIGVLLAWFAIAHLLNHTLICNVIIYVVVAGAFLYFFKIAWSLPGVDRTRMLVALVLIIQAVLFFVLYNQMPTSLTFFAVHNVDNTVWGWSIPPAEYQVLNPLIIVLASPILVRMYRLFPATHVTKFCIGMSLAALAFLVLAIPSFTSSTAIVSPGWMVLTYLLQSIGELLISALGLSMVAELCPSHLSGFAMGVWLLTSMLAGPVGAWVGAMTVPTEVTSITPLAGLHLYGQVFVEIGLVTSVVAVLMWLARPFLNRLLQTAPHINVV